MAEESSAGWKIAVWAGENFGGGLLKAGGVTFFDDIAGLFGLETAKSDPKVLAKLDELSKKLDLVVQGIARIENRLDVLSTQLSLVQSEIEKTITERTIGPAKARIQTHYAGIAAKSTTAAPRITGSTVASKPTAGIPRSAASMPLISLKELVQRRMAGQEPDVKTVEAFLDNIIVDWDIPSAVNEIRGALVGENNETGLLRVWTRLFINKMGKGQRSPDLFAYYESLEQRFMANLAIQLQGVSLVMAVKCYGAPAGQIPTEAASYLYESFASEVLQEQTDVFLQCVEELVLSQGVWRSPCLYVENYWKGSANHMSDDAGVGVPPDLANILMRAEVLVKYLLESFRDMRNYPDPQRRGLAKTTAGDRANGLYVHLLSDPRSLADADTGPELIPWPQGASNGRMLPASGVAIPAFSLGRPDGYARLSKPEQSKIRLVRYFWPWLEMRGPSDPNFYEGKRWSDYHLRTTAVEWLNQPPWSRYHLETARGEKLEVPWKNAELAHIADLTRLRGRTSGLLENKAWTIEPIFGIDSGTDAELTTEGLDRHVLDVAMDSKIDYPDKQRRAWFSLKGTQKQPTFSKAKSTGEEPQARAQAETPLFTYTAGALDKPRTLRLQLGLYVTVQRDDFPARGKLYQNPVSMSTRVKVGIKGPNGSVVDLYDSYQAKGGALNFWEAAPLTSATLPEWKSGAGRTAEDRPTISHDLTIGNKPGEVEYYKLWVHLFFYHYSGGVYSPWPSASVDCLIQELAFSWR